MSLPKYQTSIQELSLLQSRWATILNPLIDNVSNKRSILKNVSLIAGTNVIDHKLGERLTGWNIIRKRAAASIYDAQDSNATPQLTLVLISDVPVVCDIEVM